MGQYSKQKVEGYFTIVTPDQPTIEGETVQCRHCGSHFPISPGSGKIRGFCFNCNGPICGPDCQECIPYEKRLDMEDSGKSPTAVSVATPSKLWLPD